MRWLLHFLRLALFSILECFSLKLNVWLTSLRGASRLSSHAACHNILFYSTLHNPLVTPRIYVATPRMRTTAFRWGIQHYLTICHGDSQTKPFHLLPLLNMAATDWPTKHFNTRPIFHSPPRTAADFQSSTFPHSLYSPTPPLSHHICLSALRVKDREGQADMQRTALHQSGDRECLCQLNGMCLCRKSQTHVLFSPPTPWLLPLFSTT